MENQIKLSEGKARRGGINRSKATNRPDWEPTGQGVVDGSAARVPKETKTFRIHKASGYSDEYRHSVDGKPIHFVCGLVQTDDPELIQALSTCAWCFEVK